MAALAFCSRAVSNRLAGHRSLGGPRLSGAWLTCPGLNEAACVAEIWLETSVVSTGSDRTMTRDLPPHRSIRRDGTPHAGARGELSRSCPGRKAVSGSPVSTHVQLDRKATRATMAGPARTE